MSDRVFTYRIQGTTWCQKPLLYGEDMKVKAILGEELKSPGITETAYAEAFGKLYDSGRLGDVFAILLKPYAGSKLLAWWNNLRIRRKQLLPHTLIQKMTKREIAEVVRDFFVIRGSWEEDLLRSALSLSSKQATTSDRQNPWVRPKYSTISPTEISNTPASSN